jgi:hypothetical protein
MTHTRGPAKSFAIPSVQIDGETITTNAVSGNPRQLVVGESLTFEFEMDDLSMRGLRPLRAKDLYPWAGGGLLRPVNARWRKLSSPSRLRVRWQAVNRGCATLWLDIRPGGLHLGLKHTYRTCVGSRRWIPPGSTP